MTNSTNTSSSHQYKPGYIPLGKNLLVLPIVTEEVTAGGIVLPTQVKEREDMKVTDAIVIAIAPGAWVDQTERSSSGERIMSHPWCAVGDIISMSTFAGTHRKGSDGLLYRIIRDLDIVALKTPNPQDSQP